jgi:hypothetical protein
MAVGVPDVIFTISKDDFRGVSAGDCPIVAIVVEAF